MYPFERAEPWMPRQIADEGSELDAADDFYDQRYDRELMRERMAHHEA